MLLDKLFVPSLDAEDLLLAWHVGIPEWNTATGGNHDWVETWDAGVWSFTGAAEFTDQVCSLLTEGTQLD